MAKQIQGQARTDGTQTALGFVVRESPLPIPEDLARFKEIDASIVKWIMQYADKEQEARIKLEQNFGSERVSITKSEHGIVKTSLWLAFAIAVLFISLSGVLIFSGMEIAGTAFGGIALVMCVQAFLKFGRKQKQ